MPDIAVYPGSFDPITNGHLDLIQRALKIFDRIIVAVATNAFKKSLFTIEERMEMIRVVPGGLPQRSPSTPFDGLLVKYAREQKARAILRGLQGRHRFRVRISAGHDEPAAGTGNRDGVSHDRPALGFLQLQHPQGGGGAWRRHRRHGAGNRVSQTAGKIRALK